VKRETELFENLAGKISRVFAVYFTKKERKDGHVFKDSLVPSLLKPKLVS
jgi:hypothetical protein